ncbi:hypothetical protein [Vulcanococcus sp.]|uniref:hypothetical protein n=1 Tax=Vulcanococcus sp. TaxID=2856995 RepID=UPI003C00B4D6
MAGAALGPIYGPIPELDPSWATDNPQTGAPLYTPAETRELIRDSQGISGGYRELHKLSQAMNSAAAISPLVVAKIQDMVVRWVAIDLKASEIRSETPDAVGLPLIRADVVEYSEEPLRAGKAQYQVRTQALEEEAARLTVKICKALNLELFDLEQAPCCMQGAYGGGMTTLVRS